MDGTARGLGTTTADLARMTPSEQLPYVELLLSSRSAVASATLESVYHRRSSWATRTPPARRCSAQGTAAYSANAPLDFDDGRITTDEATSAVRNRMGRPLIPDGTVPRASPHQAPPTSTQ